MANVMSTSLSVRVLGSMIVAVDGVVADMTRRQVRQLLALLTVAAGHPVPADVLIDELWPGDLPDDPKRALRVVVSRLRSSLRGASVHVESVGTGYQLSNGADVAIDTEMALSLSHEAQAQSNAEDRAELLTEALAYWRGEPFSDCGGPRRLDLHREQFVSLRHDLTIQLAECLLHLGMPMKAIALAQEACDRRPEDQRVVRVLAASLARVGRKRESLAAIESCRRQLREASGLDIGAELSSLERAVLTGGIDMEAGFSSSAPVDDVPIVSREDELTRIVGVRTPSTCLIVGQSGIGKSTLLAEIARLERSQNVAVIGVSASVSPSRPLEPIADLVLQLAASQPGLASLPRYRDAVARLVPEAIGVEGSRMPLTRDVFVERLAGFIGEAAPASSAVVLLDDFQWLDAPSVQVLDQLRAAGRTRLVIASRRGEHDASPTSVLWRRLEEDSASPDSLHELSPIEPSGVMSMLRGRVPSHANEYTTQMLHQWTGGHPLFVALLVESLREGALSADELPPTVLLAVQQRASALSGRAHDLLRLIAVAGNDVRIDVLRELRPSAGDDLDDIEAAGLLHRTDGSVARVRFRHLLVRDAVNQMVAEGHRVAWQDQIADILTRIDGAPAEILPHAVAAASLNPTRALEAVLAAADAEMAVFGWEVALDILESGAEIHQMYAAGDVRLECELAGRRGISMQALSHDDATSELLRATELAELADMPEMFARCVTALCGHGRTTEVGTVNVEARTLLDRALGLQLPAAIRAELFATSAVLYAISADAPKGRERFLEGWRLATDLGDVELEGRVLLNSHLGLSHAGDIDLRRRAAERLAAISDGDPDLAWEAAFVGFSVELLSGDRAALDQRLSAMRRRTRELARRRRTFALKYIEATYAHLIGDLEASERHITEFLDEAREIYSESWAFGIYSAVLVGLRRSAGRLSELAPVVDGLIAGAPEYITWRVVASAVAAAGGDHERAAREIDIVSADGFAGLIDDHAWTVSGVLLSDALAFTGDAPRARQLFDLMEPFSHTMSWNAISTFGPMDDSLARLAHTFGDPALEAEHRARAAAVRRRLGID